MRYHAHNRTYQDLSISFTEPGLHLRKLCLSVALCLHYDGPQLSRPNHLHTIKYYSMYYGEHSISLSSKELDVFTVKTSALS